jgi:retron-type reverse transcriptase
LKAGPKPSGPNGIIEREPILGTHPDRESLATEVQALMHRGHPEIVDADLADYFGSIPHAELLKSVARRIVDRRMLHLIKMWLECPVEETDERGRRIRSTGAKDSRRGIPQGSPVSPLLANLYMRRFVLGWKKLGLEQSLGTRLVTYADETFYSCRTLSVLCCAVLCEF